LCAVLFILKNISYCVFAAANIFIDGVARRVTVLANAFQKTVTVSRLKRVNQLQQILYIFSATS